MLYRNNLPFYTQMYMKNVSAVKLTNTALLVTFMSDVNRAFFEIKIFEIYV